jgi:mRNA interferase RelE/StbE
LAEFRIFETDQFQKDLRAIARAGQPGIVERLAAIVYPQLRIHPRFGPHARKLKNYDPETWRYRIGSWRFFYEIDDEERIVFMTAASHRGGAYRS